MSIDVKNIKNINWYHQGGAILLFYSFIPYTAISSVIGYESNIIYQKGRFNMAFFDKDKESRLFWLAILKQSKDKSFIDNYIDDWRRQALLLYNFCKASFKEPVENWTDKKLSYFLNKFIKLSLNMWSRGLLIELSDPDGINLLKKFLSEHEVSLSEDRLRVLTSPRKVSFLQEELFNSYKIAKKISLNLDISDDLSKHYHRYFAMKNNWADVSDLNEEYFLNKSLEISSNLSYHKRLINDTRKELARLRKRQQYFYNSDNISQQVKNVVYMFSQMAQWRDERKLLSTAIPHSYLHKIIKRLAKENGVSFNIASFLTPSEISAWKVRSGIIDRARLRKKGTVYLCTKDYKGYWFYGEKAKRVFKALSSPADSFKDELTGAIANKGLARGRVKLVDMPEDFKKVKKGDIIVAHMTRPEYFPILNLASAIITDEGGLTCHAAIVSREFKIPCIVGTQIATKVLKDGDIVEVDANEGLVRRLKK